MPDPVLVACLDGLEAPACDLKLEVSLDDDVDLVVDLVDRARPKPVVLASITPRGLRRLYRALEDEGLPWQLVNVTSVAEAVAAGVSLDTLLEYWVGYMRLLAEGLEGVLKRVERPVSRREALRRLFLPRRFYTVVPKLRGSCDPEACPYGVLAGGSVNEAGCRGCMVCGHACPSVVPLRAVVAVVLYAYSFAYWHGAGWLLATCTRSVEAVSERLTEVQDQRVVPVHLPCLGWLHPAIARAVTASGMGLAVYMDAEACGECYAGGLASRLAESLARAGARVAQDLALPPPPRLPRRPEDAAKLLEAVLDSA